MSKRKKHAEEHENLERWLVSYADFMTLLFATFVVLYALSQIDLAKFKDLQISLKKAFSFPSVIQGDQGILNNSGDSILSSGGMDNESNMIPPMFENMEAKYEESSFNEAKETVEKLEAANEIEGVDISVNERGLVINLLDNVFFASGSAALKSSAYNTLLKVDKLLEQKFSNNPIRVEGHTDSEPLESSSIYPSNWELSSARASSVVRFLLAHSKINKNRFAAVGYADSRPIASNDTAEGRNKNRRVEIVVLRNKLAKSESKISGINQGRMERIKNSEQVQKKELEKYQTISDAAKQLLRQTGESINNVLFFQDNYQKQSEELAKELKEKENNKKKEIKLPDTKLQKPANLTPQQKAQIEEARKKGIINDAVAELMKQSGSTQDVIIIEQGGR